MLIDKYMEKFDFHEKHTIVISASPEKIYSEIEHVNFHDSWVIRFLFFLRGLPKSMQNLSGFIQAGFFKLEEKVNEEIAIAFIASFRKGLRQIDPSQFALYNKPKHILGVWNFSVKAIKKNETLLVTETRVRYTDKWMKNLFTIYWFLIAPFSGWIRIIILRLIKKKVESQAFGR